MAKKKVGTVAKELKKKVKKVDYQKMLDNEPDKIVKDRMLAEFKKKGLIE